MKIAKLMLIALISYSSTTFSMDSVYSTLAPYASKETVNDCARGFIGGMAYKHMWDALVYHPTNGSREAARNAYLLLLISTAKGANIAFPIDAAHKWETLKRIAIRSVATTIGFATKGLIANLW